MDRVILHSDLNNFYASVECLYDPSIRGKPVAVAGDPEARHGIILAKNYEAKKYGIQTGEPLWRARQKCSELVFVAPHYERYLQYSGIAKEIYGRYTDQVESYGLDECWLDVSGSTSLFGDGGKIADEIRRRIKFELGVTASVGVSYNKIFAKLGSDMKKPDATTIIEKQHFQQIVWPLPVKELLYVGRSTQKKLEKYGIHTIGALAQSERRFLKTILGLNGEMLWLFANGLDVSPVSDTGAEPTIKSVGNSTTAPRDLTTDQEIKITLMVLCESVSARLRELDFICGTVQVGIRDNRLFSYERQGKLLYPNRTAKDIFDKAFQLYRQNRPCNPVRSLSVRACRLETQEQEQLSIFPDAAVIQRAEKLEGTMDSIRSRFGHFALRRGLLLTDPALSGGNPKEEHIIHPERFFRG